MRQFGRRKLRLLSVGGGIVDPGSCIAVLTLQALDLFVEGRIISTIRLILTFELFQFPLALVDEFAVWCGNALWTDSFVDGLEFILSELTRLTLQSQPSILFHSIERF